MRKKLVSRANHIWMRQDGGGSALLYDIERVCPCGGSLFKMPSYERTPFRGQHVGSFAYSTGFRGSACVLLFCAPNMFMTR